MSQPYTAGKVSKTYHCGTLTYTKAGLLAICAWLLWGDFCFFIMESVVPSVLPINLKALGCPDWVLGVIVGMIPNILSAGISPVVAFKSDRFRSRWGRRIPFIVGTLPFLCLSLILLGFSKDIGAFLHAHVGFLKDTNPATLTIITIGVFVVAFQFFNTFVSTLFFFLFNDVIPAELLGRFTGMFKIIGSLASAFYQFFIFQHSASHMREIFLGASLLYFLGFGLLCWRVKEGEYPPVTGEEESDSRGFRGVKTFFAETFSNGWYRLFFVWLALPALARGINIFGVFFAMEMGMTLDNIGKQGAIWSATSIFAMYLAARFIDRWHPLRVQVYLSIFTVITGVSSWVWIFVTLPGNYFFWLSTAGNFISVFLAALATVSSLLIQMRILPKSRFGQMCSGYGLVSSVFTFVASLMAGLFLDAIRWMYFGSAHSPEFAYRFNFLWTVFFSVISAALSVRVYSRWYRLGGDKAYRAPAPWSPEQFEDMDAVPTVTPQARWLSLSLRIFGASMWIPLLSFPALVWWMNTHGALFAAHWYLQLILPLLISAWVVWIFVARGIRSDMARSLENKPLHNGIPHHGLLMVMSIASLLSLFVWLAQILITVVSKMDQACVLFGIGQVVTGFLLSGVVLLAARMERGHSNTLASTGA